MQMPSSISAAMKNRTLLALSRASFKAGPPPRGFFFFLFFTPQPLHFYTLLLFPPFRFGLLCFGFGGAWALSGSSKQAQIMNRVRKQLSDYERERGGGEGNGCTHWYSIECLVEACLEQ